MGKVPVKGQNDKKSVNYRGADRQKEAGKRKKRPS